MSMSSSSYCVRTTFALPLVALVFYYVPVTLSAIVQNDNTQDGTAAETVLLRVSEKDFGDHRVVKSSVAAAAPTLQKILSESDFVSELETFDARSLYVQKGVYTNVRAPPGQHIS